MDKFHVTFTDVGRNKRSWEAELPLTESAFIRSIKLHSALMSQGIEIDFKRGWIIVGGFRVVGHFEIIKQGQEIQYLSV